MKKVLVVGGAGYIGSHMVKSLLQAKYEVVILDNLVDGHADAIIGGVFIQGDIADRELLQTLFREHSFDDVLHFAAHIQVAESVERPEKYYRNNVANAINLFDAAVKQEVPAFVFSSSAAVFGEPQFIPIDEGHPCRPINPYGRSKLMVEEMLEDFDRAYGLKHVCLRYFNAAGADHEGQLGVRHDPEIHLIPVVLRAAPGRRECVTVFGRDYDTPDRTCIRDYVHVLDLCQGHLLALEYLWNGADSTKFNLGNGQGFSVQQVIDAAERVTGRGINVIDGPRRPGDPARLAADSTKAERVLSWRPRYSELETIIEHAWSWELRAV